MNLEAFCQQSNWAWQKWCSEGQKHLLWPVLYFNERWRLVSGVQHYRNWHHVPWLQRDLEIKQSAERVPKSTKWCYSDKKNACFLCGKAMQIKRPTWFFLFSTMHDEMRVSKDQQAKPQPKVYYDHMKDGVDAVDLMSAMASKREKNKCWTMNALFYMLDTVPTNCRTL